MAGSTIFVSRSDLSSKQVRSAKSIGHNPHTVGAAEFQVLSQELFRDALVRERRRADRFDEAFAVVLFTLIGETARESRWSRLAIAISQATAGSDVTGWYQHGTTLGLIRPAADSVSPETATTVAARVQRELERYLNPEAVSYTHLTLPTNREV